MLRVAYHSTNCPKRLEDEGGFLDGYVFQGEILYEVQKDGRWLAVSTFRDFPKPISGEHTPGAMPQLPVPANEGQEETQPEGKRIALEAYTYEEWCKKYPGYAKNAERKLEEAKHGKGHTFGQSHYPAYNPTKGTTYTYKPEPKYFDQIDKKKWPNAWKWSLRFFYAPDFNRNTRYKYEGNTIYSNAYGMD